MEAPHNNEINYELIWSAVKWFFGGLSAIFSVLATTIIGKMWREHNKMYEWYVSNIDPERVKMKDRIDQHQSESLKKYHEDVASIKHEFADIKQQVMPLLKKWAEEELTISDRMIMIDERLEDFMKKYEK